MIGQKFWEIATLWQRFFDGLEAWYDYGGWHRFITIFAIGLVLYSMAVTVMWWDDRGSNIRELRELLEWIKLRQKPIWFTAIIIALWFILK